MQDLPPKLQMTEAWSFFYPFPPTTIHIAPPLSVIYLPWTLFFQVLLAFSSPLHCTDHLHTQAGAGFHQASRVTMLFHKLPGEDSGRAL